MRQTYLEASRIINHYGNKIVYPEDYYPTCCNCNEYASYEVLGRYYCSSCIWEIAEEDERKEGEWCEYCGDDSADEGIRIGGDFYCKECFEKSFRKD